MAKQKTVIDAVKGLSPDVGQAIVDCFATINCMDLYDGNLVNYLKVINQEIVRRDNMIEFRDKKLKEIKKILNFT